MLPIPEKLLEAGVRDMVRISDARMSRTSCGTCIALVSPEAAVGGPSALVRTGDRIVLDVAGRRLELRVPEDKLARRRPPWRPRALPGRGGKRLYLSRARQAHEGCDFDFLEAIVPMVEPAIH